MDRPGQDPQCRRRGNLMQPHPRRRQSVARRRHRAVLDDGLQHATATYWEKWFPADFITECFPGQFRNWFYAHPGDEHDDGAAAAVQGAARPRPGARRARRGDAQVEGQRHPVRRAADDGYETEAEQEVPADGRRPDALAVLPAQPGERTSTSAPAPPTRCAASSS